MTFTELHDIAKLCVDAMDNDLAFDFLANGKSFLCNEFLGYYHRLKGSLLELKIYFSIRDIFEGL